MKLAPLTVRTSAGPPAVAPAGFRSSIDGTGFWFGWVIVKLSELDVPPPGGGLITSTGRVPAVVSSAAPTVALSWLLLRKVVARSVALFQRTLAPGTKSAPFTISVI